MTRKDTASDLRIGCSVEDKKTEIRRSVRALALYIMLKPVDHHIGTVYAYTAVVISALSACVCHSGKNTAAQIQLFGIYRARDHRRNSVKVPKYRGVRRDVPVLVNAYYITLIGTVVLVAAVTDIDTAVEIAVSIFNGIERKRIHEGQKVQYVFFDTEDEVWIVSFWKDRGYGPYAMIAEGSFNIAIQKSDAKVLRMWVG